MKRLFVGLTLVLLLCGCAQPVMETVDDAYVQPVSAMTRQVLIELPEDASQQTMEGEGGTLYFCGDYTLCVQTLPGGDIEKTLRSCTGYGMEELTGMQTRQANVDRYEAVFTTSGEQGMEVGRISVLNDGNYHYVLTALIPEAQAGELQKELQTVFASFRLSESTDPVNIGS